MTLWLPSVDSDAPSNVTVNMPDQITVRVEQPSVPFVNSAEIAEPSRVMSWDDYVGQGPLKRQLRVFIDAALADFEPLPHTLLASPMPGVGKTTLARLITQELGANLTMLVPPFSPSTLYEAAMQLGDHDVLFIDEIHKLADHGPAAAENLLHLMAERTLYLDDGVRYLCDFTLIGATTDADKLPEPLIDRFKIKPYFQRYTAAELIKIVKTNFCRNEHVALLPETMVAIAKACRDTPRIAEELVLGAKALQRSTGRYCTPEELLAFKEYEPDGMTRQHIAYILAMYQFFGREKGEDGWEYVAGEASLMTILRENKPALARLERFLIERGLIDRTPRGRRLTDRGIVKAREYLARGKRLGTD